MAYWADVPLSYALSPVVKTVPAIPPSSRAVALSPLDEHDAMSPAPTRTASAAAVTAGARDSVGEGSVTAWGRKGERDGATPGGAVALGDAHARTVTARAVAAVIVRTL